MLHLVAGGAVGAVIGGLVGRSRSCTTGGCPLTANPTRGAAYGALLGVLAMMAFGSMGSVEAVDYASVIQPVESVDTFRDATGDDSGVTVAYFGADWCGPCHRFRPTLNAVAEAQSDNATFLRIDVDQMGGLAFEYNVRSVPTTIIFKDGDEVQRLSGVVSKQRLTSAVS